MGHNFWTGSDRDFWSAAKCSLENAAFECDHPFDVRRRHVFTSRDLQKNDNIWKNFFLQIVKVKGQTQGQGQINVKGQAHMEIRTILHVIDVI